MDIDFSILDNWYGKLIPKWFGDLIQFTVNSNQLAREIIETPIVIDSNQIMPYLKNGICYLPATFYHQKFYSEYLKIKDIDDMIYSAVALVNGGQIHEAMHKLILGKNDDYLKIVEFCGFKYVEGYLSDVHKMCFNLIEDVYSEYVCSLDYPFIYPFIELMNRVLFNDNVYRRRLNDLSEGENVSTIFNVLLTNRNPDNAKIDNLNQYWEIVNKSYDKNLTLVERLEISHELYELFKQENYEKERHENDQFENCDDYQDEWQQLDIDVLQDLEDFRITDSISKYELRDIESQFYEYSSSQDIVEPEIKFIEIDTKPLPYKLNQNPLFNGFSQYLRNAKALRQSYIEPRLTGTKLLTNRLNQALVDGKIFAKRDVEQMNKGEPELIFLIDLSASMRYNELIRPTLESAMTIFQDLRENNISCAFYGHTTTHPEIPKRVLIVGIASNNMPMLKMSHLQSNSDFENRFKNCLNIETKENGDGFAIEFVSKRFSSKQGKKVLIVLSDGKPNILSANYSGEKAVNHTKNAIENLRKSNISVVSLSLTSEVMKDNNKIYGVKNNLAAYQGKFESNVKKLIENIVT